MKKAMLVRALCALAVMAVMAGASAVEAAQPMVVAGRYQTLGLKTDGTVMAVGNNYYRNLNVGDWTEIIQMAAANDFTVGLKNDGTVVAVGYSWRGQLDVGHLTEITQVATAGFHTVVLRTDGTVVAVGNRETYGELGVGFWTEITQLVSGTLGLKSDGTVVGTGYNWSGRLDVGDWTEITQMDAGGRTVGLKSDGTVVIVGELDVGDWTEITQVASGGGHIVGLKSDGTVVAVGDNRYGQLDVGDWTDITQVAVGRYHTVGLRSDGTVVAVGDNRYGQLDVADWKLDVGSGRYGAIEGQVTDASGGVEGVAVELFLIGKLASTVTDADGCYRFENVAEGGYRVHIIPPDIGPGFLYRSDARLRQVIVSLQTTSVVVADFVLAKLDLDIYGDGDMDWEDVQVINYLRGEDPDICPACDLDQDGAITGLDARRAAVLCTRPDCAVE